MSLSAVTIIVRPPDIETTSVSSTESAATQSVSQSPESAPLVVPVAPKGEHIFPATILEPLVLKWKAQQTAGQHDEAMKTLESIIKQSTPMYERLAQYENFTATVDLPTLITAAQVRTPVWLIYWDPVKGRLFSWLSKCAKYLFLAEAVRESTHRKRYHATGESLEKFFGSVDHAVVSHEAVEEVQETVRQLTCRWGDQRIQCCIRFHLACIVENPRGKRHKKTAVRAGAYASGLSLNMSKFFYHWALYSLRDATYEKMSMPYTDSDLLHLTESYTFIPDLLTIVSWKDFLKIIALLGGQRLKIPTLDELREVRFRHTVFRRLQKSNMDPDSVARISKEYRISTRNAEEIFTEMATKLDDNRLGEHALYSSETAT